MGELVRSYLQNSLSRRDFAKRMMQSGFSLVAALGMDKDEFARSLYLLKYN